jgi:hypothetical protein
MSAGLFQGLWLLAMASVPAAIGCAIFFYKRETARRRFNLCSHFAHLRGRGLYVRFIIWNRFGLRSLSKRQSLWSVWVLEPEALVYFFEELGFPVNRIGLRRGQQEKRRCDLRVNEQTASSFPPLTFRLRLVLRRPIGVARCAIAKVIISSELSDLCVHRG